VLAAAGLPIITRYLLLTAIILAIFAGAGVFGWHDLREGAQRTWWARFAVVALAGLLAFVPAQAHRINRLDHALGRQGSIQGRLADVVRPGLPCNPVAVPNRRPIPLLALWLEHDPGAIADAQAAIPAAGTYLAPRDPAVARDYILDNRDRDRSVPPPPAGFGDLRSNQDWSVFSRCSG